jgi:hypothetical protein
MSIRARFLFRLCRRGIRVFIRLWFRCLRHHHTCLFTRQQFLLHLRRVDRPTLTRLWHLLHRRHQLTLPTAQSPWQLHHQRARMFIRLRSPLPHRRRTCTFMGARFHSQLRPQHVRMFLRLWFLVRPCRASRRTFTRLRFPLHRHHQCRHRVQWLGRMRVSMRLRLCTSRCLSQCLRPRRLMRSGAGIPVVTSRWIRMSWCRRRRLPPRLQ